MDDKKIGFFSRAKKAILKFEEYEKFIVEKPSCVIRYLAKLILIFSIIVTIALCYMLKQNIKKYMDLFSQDAPEFTISNGTLDIKDDNKEFEMYFEDFDTQLIINENNQEYIKTDYANSIEVLKNKAVIKYRGLMRELPYDNVDLSKQTIVDDFNTSNILMTLYMGTIILLFTYALYIIIFLIDIFMLAIFGYIINKIIRTQFKFKEVFIISVYAMTLPIVLYLLYTLANILLGVTTKYFSIAYNAISYIYLVTVLLIMKSDIIKNTQELQNILEVEKKVKEELARQKEEERKKQEEAARGDKKEKEKNKGKNKKEPNAEPQTEN